MENHPELVTILPDGYYGVSQPNAWLMTKAIQELNTKVTVLEAANGQLVNESEQQGITLNNISAITSISGKWSIGEDGTITAVKIKTKDLEITDRATGEVYCVGIEYGEWVKAKGECNKSEALNSKSSGLRQGFGGSAESLPEGGETISNDQNLNNQNGQVAGESVEPIPDATTGDPGSSSEEIPAQQDQTPSGDGHGGGESPAGMGEESLESSVEAGESGDTQTGGAEEQIPAPEPKTEQPALEPVGEGSSDEE